MVCPPSVESHIPFGRIALYLLVLIFVIYGNTFQSAWHLDDYTSILNNTNIHVNNLSPSTLLKAVHAPSATFDGGAISRPLAMLSFALNWYCHQSRLAGYHLVNISIHVVAAVLLYMTILVVLRQAPVLKDRYAGSCQFIALMAAVLWAVNPIQTQAVTYIVQRMAIMAAMFYILALYLYIRGRLCPAGSRRWMWWLAAAASFLAGMASKENAALFPFALVLTEVIFFQDLSRPDVRRRWFWIAGIVTLVFIIGSGLFFLKGDFSRILSGYNRRPFTLTERLLTQPRVLWLYASLLFYPVPSRLTPEYDIDLSTSLVQPWTTLPAISGLFLMVALGIMLMRRQPLVSFALLFFMLNHAIESSIIPLEIVFEHRNYLPSMFFFLPVAAGFKKLLDIYRVRRRGMHLILVGFGILVMIGWGMGTYIRNMAWATEETLWRDAIRKAPRSYRAVHNLAWGYFERTGQLEEAYRLYQKSRTLEMHTRSHVILPLNNMANIRYMQGDYEAAAMLWKEALAYAPNYPDYLYRYALALTEAGDFDRAMACADRLIAMGQYRNGAQTLRGRLLLLQGKHRQALTIFQQVYRRNPGNPVLSYNIGLTLAALRCFSQAEILLKRTLGLGQDDLKTMVWLARVNYIAGDQNDFNRFVGALARRFSLDRIGTALQKDAWGVVLSRGDRSAADAAIFDWLGVHYLSRKPS